MLKTKIDNKIALICNTLHTGWCVCTCMQAHVQFHFSYCGPQVNLGMLPSSEPDRN